MAQAGLAFHRRIWALSECRFLYQVLDQFGALASGRGDTLVAERCASAATALRENLEKHAWVDRAPAFGRPALRVVLTAQGKSALKDGRARAEHGRPQRQGLSLPWTVYRRH